MAAFLIIGMTVFLIICTVYPNGLNLRPSVFPRENIFVDLVRYVYSIDTPTNVLPSMHVFNSIGLCIGLTRTESLKNRSGIRLAIYLFTLSIIPLSVYLRARKETGAPACASADNLKSNYIPHIFFKRCRDRVAFLYFFCPGKYHIGTAGLLQLIHLNLITDHMPLYMAEYVPRFS